MGSDQGQPLLPRLKPILQQTGLALVVTTVLGFPLWVGLLADGARFEAQPCRVVPDGATWCEDARFDDGWVRRSRSATDKPGCCL